ncbi:MAG: tetratricopeptide repeat protein [Myxococcales bacterium]|nr:tetratricopeptide repeat protein [Myxococcales bacterium]
MTSSTKPQKQTVSQEDEFDFPSNAATEPPRSPKLWLQVLLFLVILGFAIFPYLVRNVPWLERWFSPGVSTERKGDAALQQGNCAEAIQAYQKAREAIQSTNQAKHHTRRLALLHYKSAFCLLRQEKLAEATEQGESAVQQDPPWALPYELVLRLYLRQEKATKLPMIRKNVESYFADQWKMWLLLGDVYTHTRDYAQALDMYEKGLKLAPQQPELLDHTARALLLKPKTSAQEAQRAEELAQQSLKYIKSYQVKDARILGMLQPYMLETLALAQEERGKLKEALQHAQKALGMAQDRTARQRFNRLIERLQQRLAPPPVSRPSVAPATRYDLPPTTRMALPFSHPSIALPPSSQPSTLRLLPPPPLPHQDPHKPSKRLLTPFE